jgi:hypothetical protein
MTHEWIAPISTPHSNDQLEIPQYRDYTPSCTTGNEEAGHGHSFVMLNLPQPDLVSHLPHGQERANSVARVTLAPPESFRTESGTSAALPGHVFNHLFVVAWKLS